MSVQLRRATLSDIPVLEYWDTKDHVIAATGDDGDMDWHIEISRNVQWQQILIAELDERPIGVLLIIDPAEEETHYWGDCGSNLRAIDIWIGEEADLGRGFGHQMMTLAIDQCFDRQDVKAVLIDPLAANTGAQKFYARLGFDAVGQRRFGRDECLVMRLERASWPAHRD